MEVIFQTINLYMEEIILMALSLALIAITIAFINYWRTSKVIKKYKRMMRGMDNKNLEYMLLNHLEAIDKVNNRMEALDLNVKSVSEQLGNCVQKVGIVRYNPFDQMGGDQSFSVALLDHHGDGVVLTGLYSREASSIFAKPLIGSESKYPLSDEEKQAIDLAIKN